MRTLQNLGLIALVALLLAGCGRAAELIPGDAGDAPSRTAAPTEAPDATSTPILVTPTLELGGRGAAAATQVIPDAELARSIVQLQMLDDATASPTAAPRMVRNGSAVVVDAAQRLLLTSYPLVDPAAADGSVAYDRIVVATSRTVGGEPSVEYEAEIVAADPATDLAVLRVVRRAGGGALSPSAFDLPAARMGDGSQTGTGDPLRLFGHPGIEAGGTGSQAITVTAAQVIGFRGDAAISGRAWIKSDARLPFGTQGGPAFDRTGTLIGVLVQPVFNPSVRVAQIRPTTLAAPLLRTAEATGPEGRFRAPLIARAGVTGSAGAPWVSTPAFAQNAIDGPLGRDLFDYQDRFVSGVVSFYYEYVALGIADGTVVEERVYRDDVLQDQLSSSYPWNLGPFGNVTDRILTPNPAGLPDGRWRIEVWVAGVLAAASTAHVGVEPRSAGISLQSFAFGSTATADRNVQTPAQANAPQLLFFFNYEGMEEARQIRWLVFRNGQAIYQSPEVPWTGGAAGRWWVGYRGDGASLGPGTWEFELQVDGRVMLVGEVVL